MDKISKMVKDEKDINYDILKQIEQHAKEYETYGDKKEFLKSVGAYEQKLILLNSSHPYEVLHYMEELDLPATKLILSELNYDEILKILALFTAEDKKLFYTTFSDLDLVNKFITYDKKASEYINDLSIDRKIDLLNSSDSETVLASSKVFASISDEEKQQVVSEIKTADGISALSDSYSYDDSNLEVTNSHNKIDIQEDNNLKLQQEVANEQELTEQEQIEEMKQELTEEDLELEAEINYFKNNFENYKLTNPELKNVDINDPHIYSLLSTVLLDTIKKDYKKFANDNLENKVVINNMQEANQQNVDPKNVGQNISRLDQSNILEEFQQTKKQNESELIQGLNAQFVSSNQVFKEENTEKPRVL